MCGIAGFCNLNTDYTRNSEYWHQILVDMRKSVSHRGRDNTGEYLRRNVGLGHTRLAIRDLCFGAQPIVRNISGKEYVIVYNGEIYNTDELTPELKREGFVFETTTDTEVILYAYIHHGIDFVSRLNGIFAFAIWDEACERLVLYRDRFGVKPLFYTIKDDTLVFGSEIKALFCFPAVKPEIDIGGLREIFGVGPARTPGNGVFKGINEIKPGHYAVFSKEGFNVKRYWELESRPHTDSYEETVDKVSFLVRDAVKRQMVSDVPVCSFLSGGIDSSIVTAVASGYLSGFGLKLNTFSFDFKDNGIYFKSNSFQPERDRPYVDIMLSEYNLNHTYLECDECLLADLLFDVVDAKDLPGMADIDASLLYFCRLVKAHNKVALTGECADEIFGGYPWFYRNELLWTDGFPWSRDISARTLLLTDDFVKELNLDEYVSERYSDSLKSVPFLEGESPADKRRREITYLNIKWFMQTLLDRMDRASMYSGLEARVPFADHRIIEYVFNVPWDMKLKDGVEKSLLRESCKDLLPRKLLYRKKSPYPKTYHPNYERLLSQMFTDILNDPNSPIVSLVDKNKAMIFLKSPSEYGKPWFGQLMAAPQLLAYMIQVNYWLEKYSLL
ncbi:asparagine synthase (glutamine-hydrolyzing) [Thermoclostridium stercorarium]|uniref:asparagine synthase (glutamine-hydrolyzing) n=1 Tax=Thermoclostridium stercorarium TaxID=1510 RepID=UPI0022490F6D|nr:asparagine synthase (glutamine-hydrolyzing) [Thermoclostridium stercorarium]UZQ84726.1 asparagine synthase (glutamine-hydrolyzing) [Thermoclostridium stercorarium]